MYVNDQGFKSQMPKELPPQINEKIKRQPKMGKRLDQALYQRRDLNGQ